MNNNLTIQPQDLSPQLFQEPLEFAASDHEVTGVQGAPGTLNEHDAQGALTVQAFPGASTDQDAQGTLINEDFELFDATAIVNFTLIPDYKDMAISAHPTVVKTPTRIVCVDGYEMVNGAMQTNHQQIRCHTYFINSDDDNEIAIRKAAIRVLPAAGKCSYAELVRNVKILFNLLCATTNNPKIYQHGGVRRGEKFTGNKEDDVRTLLEIRLGKSRGTVNKYLNHGEYLTETFLQQLVEKKEGKKFFEDAQSNKRIRVENLEGHRLDDKKIIAPVISMDMKKWLEEYSKTQTITSIKEEPVASAEKKIKAEDAEPKEFTHFQPSAATTPPQVSADGIYEQLEAAAGSLNDFIKGKPEIKTIPSFLQSHMKSILTIIRMVSGDMENDQGERTNAEETKIA